MARATFRDVGKRYGDVPALSGFDLDVADGELVAIVGPSGCGKSTLLRLTAGLESLDAGAIALDGVRVDALPPGARDVAMVFQSYALYPHLTVRQNIEFPLRMRGVGRRERAARAAEVAALLELDGLLDRRPAALSGGQRQRVALARAVVRRPKLFLLDEPLSNLDARLRGAVRVYLRDLQRRLGVTTLYVTHDQTEAMTLGDRVVVLAAGRIQQVDEPLAVYERPANAFVAGFVGTPPMNLLPADVVGPGRLRVGGATVTLPDGLASALGSHGGPLTIGVRPEAFVPADAGAQGGLAADVDPRTREVLGSETLVRARLGDAWVVVRLFGTVHALPARVVAPATALHCFAADGGRRIEAAPALVGRPGME